LDEIVKRVTDDVVALHQLYATVRNAFGEYVFGFSLTPMTIAQVIGVCRYYLKSKRLIFR